MTDWKQQLSEGINTIEGWGKDFDEMGTGDEWCLEFIYSKKDADSLRGMGVTEAYIKWLYENDLYDEITSENGNGEPDQYLRFWVVKETLNAYQKRQTFTPVQFRIIFPNHEPDGIFSAAYIRSSGKPYGR